MLIYSILKFTEFYNNLELYYYEFRRINKRNYKSFKK